MSAIYRMLSLTAAALSLLSAVLITGGADAAERYIYEMVIENNLSKVSTSIQVYAESEREARENVTANGWSVLSLRQISYETVDLVTMREGDNESMQVAVVDAPGSGNLSDIDNVSDNRSTPGPRLTDDELIASVMRANAPRLPQGVYNVAYVPLPAEQPAGDSGSQSTGTPLNARQPGTTAYLGTLAGAGAPMGGNADLLGNVPDMNRLLFRYAVFFDFGKIDPVLSDEDTAMLKSMPQDGRYYLFGHTDNVRVRANSYYTDNFDLSFKRAEGIKTRLGEYGIDPANANTIGLGPLYPAVENRPGGTPENRRVDIYEYETE